MLVSKPMPVAGELYPSDGVKNLEVGTFSGVPHRGGGIQRTPGDEVMVGQQSNHYITGCAQVGGGGIYGACAFFHVIRQLTSSGGLRLTHQM